MPSTTPTSITSWSTSDLHRLLLSLHISNALYPHFTSLLPSHPPSSIRSLLLHLTLPAHPTASTWPTANLARHILTLHNGNPYTPRPHPPCTRRGRITLRVTPFSPTDAAAVTRRNHNPNVEVILRGARPVWDVVVHFFHKWGLPVRLCRAQEQIRDLTMPVFYLVASDARVSSVVTLQFEVLHLQFDVSAMVDVLKGRQKHPVRANVGRGKRVCAPPTPQRANVKRKRKTRMDGACSAQRQRLATRAAEAALAALNSVERKNAPRVSLASVERGGANIDLGSPTSLRKDMLKRGELENMEMEGMLVTPENNLGTEKDINGGNLTSLIDSPLRHGGEGNGEPVRIVERGGTSASPFASETKEKEVTNKYMNNILGSVRGGEREICESLFAISSRSRDEGKHSELERKEEEGCGNLAEKKEAKDEGVGLGEANVTNFESAKRILSLDDIGEELSLEGGEESEGEKAVMERLQCHLKKLDNGENVGAAKSNRGDDCKSVQVEGFSCSALIPDAFLKSGSAFEIGALAKLSDSILAIGKAEDGSEVKAEIGHLDNASDGVELNGEDEWERDLGRMIRPEEGKSLSLTGIFRSL